MMNPKGSKIRGSSPLLREIPPVPCLNTESTPEGVPESSFEKIRVSGIPSGIPLRCADDDTPYRGYHSADAPSSDSGMSAPFNPRPPLFELFGFSLVEVTLALGVAGFCLTALCALLPIGLTSNQAALEQTMAAGITSAIVIDLDCAAPLGTVTTPHFGITIPAAQGTTPSTSGTSIYLAADGSASPTGKVVTSGTAVSRYRATIGFTPPLGGQRTATAVRILITWPALADPAPGTPPVNYTGSYEADTTLNRN